MTNISIMPFPFYLGVFALIILGVKSWQARRRSWGLPACAVLGTVAVWYFGDAFYNNYNIYLLAVGPESLKAAWWQVLLFLVSFGLLVRPISERINGHLPERCSHAMAYMETNRLREPRVQHRIDVLAKVLIVVWMVMMAVAVVKVKGNILGLFFPYLAGEKVDPWARGQIGGGFSAIISLAMYFQVFVTAAFGVIAALALNPKTRNVALLICALAIPFYVFDRTRNTMLAVLLPGILSFVFLRLKQGPWVKAAVLLVAFILINSWFTFVMASRGHQISVSQAFVTEGTEDESFQEAKHEGLNMFEELGWINHFIETGRYKPNWGRRYFAEAVNPIPRGLWKNKPLIGLDYAVARGQQARGPKGEVTATISTGMIGQGVVNFGRFFGPIAAAVLMCLWVALLVRQDIRGSDPGRLILYGCGLILTFNLGRDITLLVMYPFLFGLLVYWFWEKFIQPKSKPNAPTPANQLPTKSRNL